MMKKKYSIIVPIYNAEKYIVRCIDSITSQSYSNIEIILVNDGSTDNTKKILNSYKKKDKRIVAIHLKNGGVSNARNVGVQAATGDYITFIDADDYIEPNAIQEIDSIIEREDIDIIKYNYITEIGFVKRKYHFSIKKSQIINKKDFDKFVYPYIFTTNDLSNVWNTVIKASIVKNVLFDVKLKYAEDSKFMFECLNLADNLFILDKYMYHYVQNSSSAINTRNYYKRVIQLANVLKANLFIYKEINNIEFSSSMQKKLNDAFFDYLAYDHNIHNYKSYEIEINKIFNDNNFYDIITELTEILDIDLYNQLLKMYHVIKNKKSQIKIKQNIKKILLIKNR